MASLASHLKAAAAAAQRPTRQVGLELGAHTQPSGYARGPDEQAPITRLPKTNGNERPVSAGPLAVGRQRARPSPWPARKKRAEDTS